MKNNTQPATSKLVKQFDNELMNLLMADLKAYKAKNKFVKQPLHFTTATAA